MPEPDRTPASRCLIKLRYANKDHTSVHDTTQCSSTNNQTNPDIAHILTCPPTSKTTASITFTSNSIITPQRATKDSVGYDVYCPDDHILTPGMITTISVGFTYQPSSGFYTQLLMHSSLALKGVSAFGRVIDPDYRSELIAILYNSSTNTHVIKQGDKCAQMLFLPYGTPTIASVIALEVTQCGTSGFGSTNTAQALTPTPNTTPKQTLQNSLP